MTQCCWSHVDAAEAGHLQCLQVLTEAGRFLPLDAPDRASAGEARKLQVWEAAYASCRADHPHVLSRLFASGWPSSIDAALPWHMGDLAERLDFAKEGWPDDALDTDFLPELNLYRQAVRNPTPACLEALLEAGCRSVWICRFASLEGKPAYLELAALRGCRCDLVALRIAAKAGDLPLLKEVYAALTTGECSTAELSYEAGVAAEYAVSEGHVACLSALLSWFGKSDVTSKLSEHAKQNGHVDCLQAPPRAGVLGLTVLACQAAETAQLECLKYLLDLEPGLVQLPLLERTAFGPLTPINGMALSRWRKANAGASVACMEFLQRAGCQWRADGRELLSALGRPQVLRYCLEHMEPIPWGTIWETCRCSVECLQHLYDAGYEQHRRQDPRFHPALKAVGWADRPPLQSDILPRLQLAVRCSGAPDARLFDMVGMVRAGVDVLRYVLELGAPFSVQATNAAAGDGLLAVLQYMLENGAPWDASTFEQAIWPGVSVPCLRCLLQHARTAGCPERYQRPSEGAFARRRRPHKFQQIPSLEVLQYVFNHMGPAWADPLLESTARDLAYWVQRKSARKAWEVDWQCVLYLARKLKTSLPHPLGELVAVRRERAAALAGAFFKAGKLARESSHPRSGALWGSMARLPEELRERIAVQAHLIFVEPACPLLAS
eukprot:jgi/Botrbrau1/22445/Bobra.0091s0047.1